jgi:hypothetical protein
LSSSDVVDLFDTFHATKRSLQASIHLSIVSVGWIIPAPLLTRTDDLVFVFTGKSVQPSPFTVDRALTAVQTSRPTRLPSFIPCSGFNPFNPRADTHFILYVYDNRLRRSACGDTHFLPYVWHRTARADTHFLLYVYDNLRSGRPPTCDNPMVLLGNCRGFKAVASR